MPTVRQWLAATLGRGRGADSPLGDNQDGPELSAQQREAVARGAEVVRRYGGVLLADAVGLGKTRVALAMARKLVRSARRRGARADPVLFVVPARLRRDWERAIVDVGWQPGRDAKVISHHRLSRAAWPERPTVVVVDEAHRFRNPKAMRSQNLAQITAVSPPILITATPVCTRRRDLMRLLGLFLTDGVVKSMVGMTLESAFAADEAGEFDVVELLEEVVIRRKTPDFGAAGRPAVRFEILRYRASADETWLWQRLEATLRALSLAAMGEHWPRGLLINNVLRMWESGPEALWRCLDELIHFHQRWLEAAEAGRSVERPAFRAIFGDTDRRQQVFSFLYGATDNAGIDLERRRKVESDLDALQNLSDRVDAVRRGGSGMIEAIAREIEIDNEQRFLIFAAYRAAAEAIFEALSARRGSRLRVGLVTGDGAYATGLGRTSDEEILDRFVGADREILPAHHQIRILVTTDCLAEGVNLQGCQRLILADLPYSPVKLEQRIGRIARPGSAVRQVTVHLPRPESWTDSLGMRRRLDERLKLASGFGAGHRLAGAMRAGTDEDRDAPGPLAAMTLEERLWRQIESSEDRSADIPQFVCAEGDRRGDLWARICIDGDVKRHIWWWFRDGERGPIVRLSDQLPGLSRLADDVREIAEWQPAGADWEALQRWIARRRSMLEAARLAPPLLGAGSEPVQIWRRLREAAKSGSIDVGGEKLQIWRAKLLRAHPPGIRHEMAQLLDGEPPPQGLIRYVEGLDTPKVSGPVQVRCVAALSA